MPNNDIGAQESNGALYDGAVSADDRTIPESIHFSDGSTLVATDPFKPIDASDVTDTSIERTETFSYET